jgi:amino acid adenylation domain-containing protein
MNQSNNIETVYPLSPTQTGMLFHSLHAPAEAGMYVQQIVCTLLGPLRVADLQRSWADTVAHHAALRAFFVWDERKEPIQVICKTLSPAWREEDWRDTPEEEVRLRERDWLAADRLLGFAADRPPLLRFALIRLDGDRYRWIWSFHHILLDGWCLSTLMAEVAERYRAAGEARAPACPSPPPYRDYLIWLRRQDTAAALAFWRDRLSDFAEPTPLGFGAPATLASSRHYDEREIVLSARLAADLATAARHYRLTLSTFAQGAWAILLSIYGGTREVLFGATVSGRPADLAGVESMIGVFINTLPVRTPVPPDVSLCDFLRRLMAEQVERERYGYAPLADIQAQSAAPGGAPLFESLLVFENYPIQREEGEAALRLLDARGYERTNYPLTLLIMPGPPFIIRAAYDAERFAGEDIVRLLGHLETLLGLMADDPSRRVGEISPLTPAELHRLAEWNATARAYPSIPTLHAAIAARAELNPEAVAVAFEGRTLTYREVDKLANRLAHRLRALGAGPERVVAVCLERSLELPAALLAVLKSGAAYLPLDPGYPAERLAFMLEDSGASLVLCQEKLRHVLPATTTALYVDIDEDAPPTVAATAPEVWVHPDHPAYVIYTSGSTGKPKAAINTHRGILNRLHWMQEAYGLDGSDRVLQKTPISFDVSVWEFFWPLLTGARLVLARPGGHQDSAYLAGLIRAEAITTLHFVPPMLRVLLDDADLSDCHALRRVICSGEALPPDLVTLFHARANAELHNLYGPTEAAIDVTAQPCGPELAEGLVPIGAPIANTQTRVLDRHLRLVPVGVAGELYLGGVQLARGYWNRPGLTAERFIPDPCAETPGARLYRTGDIARWLPNGTLEYLGRTDHQVKVRGYRIETGEVEAKLATHPNIGQVVVSAGGTGAERYLLAHLVPLGAPPSVGELRRHLLDSLPEYMVPSVFVFLDAFPLNANGKVDRARLPAPDSHRPRLETRLVAPSTEREHAIAALWRDLLGLERVGIHDNFFELGGTSLLLMPLLRRLRASVGPNLTLVDLFRHPTIAALAAHLDPAPAPPPERAAGRHEIARDHRREQRDLRRRGRQ